MVLPKMMDRTKNPIEMCDVIKHKPLVNQAATYTLDGPATGPVVMLSNSLASNLTMWDPQMPVLMSRYRVLRYDTRGHGGRMRRRAPFC